MFLGKPQQPPDSQKFGCSVCARSTMSEKKEVNLSAQSQPSFASAFSIPSSTIKKSSLEMDLQKIRSKSGRLVLSVYDASSIPAKASMLVQILEVSTCLPSKIRKFLARQISQKLDSGTNLCFPLLVVHNFKHDSNERNWHRGGSCNTYKTQNHTYKEKEHCKKRWRTNSSDCLQKGHQPRPWKPLLQRLS